MNLPQCLAPWASCGLRGLSCHLFASSNNSRRAGSEPSFASRATSNHFLAWKLNLKQKKGSWIIDDPWFCSKSLHFKFCFWKNVKYLWIMDMPLLLRKSSLCSGSISEGFCTGRSICKTSFRRNKSCVVNNFRKAIATNRCQWSTSNDAWKIPSNAQLAPQFPSSNQQAITGIFHTTSALVLRLQIISNFLQIHFPRQFELGRNRRT